MIGRMQLTDEFIDGVNVRLWREASEEFGSKFKVPSDRVWEIGEYVRALLILQSDFSKGGRPENALEVLRRFSVSDRAIGLLFEDGVLVRDVVVDERVGSRKSRLQAFEVWARGNRGGEFSTDFLVERSGFSKATLLGYLKTSRLFVRVKRGTFRVLEVGEDA